MNQSLFIVEHGVAHYCVEEAHSATPLHTTTTQAAAITWAQGHHADRPLHVARVRHLSDKRIPDHWRKL